MDLDRPLPLQDRLADELDSAQADAVDGQPLVEPTEDERRNGWTAEALTNYLAERTAGQALKLDPHSLHNRMDRRPRAANSRYSPLRWRG